MTNEILAELFRQNLWANETLLDAYAGLSDEQLDLAIPGTYGKINDTLTHLLAAEQHYVRVLSGEQRDGPLSERDGFPGIEPLRDHARWSGERLTALAGRVGAQDAFERPYQGRTYRIRKLVVLVQAIEHGTEHRTHVTVTMSYHGIAPPALDGWSYGQSAGYQQAID